MCGRNRDESGTVWYICSFSTEVWLISWPQIVLICKHAVIVWHYQDAHGAPDLMGNASQVQLNLVII